MFITLADKIRSPHTDSIAVIRGEGYVANTLRKRGIEPIIIDSKGSFNVGFIRQLCQLIKKHNIGLIQSHLLGSNVYASIVGLITRTPVIATYHGMVDVSPNERFKKLKLWFMRNGIARFVAVSRSLQEKIQEHQLLVPERTQVIYNGIDVALYTPNRSTRLKQKLALPADTYLLGALGNIRKSKRYDLLVDAVAKANKKGLNFAVVIAGDPKASLKAKLDEQMQTAGVNNIHFIGFIDDTAEYLQNLDGFILSSDAEGFSISTIEAMASGLPVIATRCGGPEEIIENRNQATLVDIDATALAEAIENNVMNNKPGFVNTDAIDRVSRAFSQHAMVAAYAKLYKSADRQYPGYEADMEPSV
ncbi:glycosyltransferase family 4 protein [Salinimonas marina]|uniref:Glycosyltransferase family 4 protein n=1 Tax=Salinimonas marina TaxID=2785918 RepID=A0A7S9DZU5_9ALTE|nr:glycosyltransferase family 4 protein [Salinimonas marina]QPG06415.1 glycosyltransferase family 4 protein [Salinimonas marina]